MEVKVCLVSMVVSARVQGLKEHDMSAVTQQPPLHFTALR